MHFVAALDDVPEMRGVLCLFEGVATGAADGYGRVAGRPAATLLHLGPGLGNGLANLHNARRARTPIVNIVGDHATYHARYDAPLQSDIASIARPVSGWYRSTARADDVAADAADAVAAAWGRPGCVATLVLPADVVVVGVAGGPLPAHGRAGGAAWCRPTRSTRWPRPCARASGRRSSWAARALRADGLHAASRVAGATGRRAAGRDLPGQPGTRGGHPGRGAAGLPGRDGPGPARRRAAPGPGRRQVPGVLLRLSRQGERPGPGGLHRAHPGPSRRGRGRRARGTGRGGGRARAAPGSPAPSGRPERPTGALTAETLAAADRGHPPRGRHRGRRGQHVGPVRPGRDGGRAPSRLADAHRRRHRHRAAHGHRRRGGGAGAAGALPAGGRERHVHAAGPVDPGPRGART